MIETSTRHGRKGIASTKDGVADVANVRTCIAEVIYKSQVCPSLSSQLGFV